MIKMKIGGMIPSLTAGAMAAGLTGCNVQMDETTKQKMNVLGYNNTGMQLPDINPASLQRMADSAELTRKLDSVNNYWLNQQADTYMKGFEDGAETGRFIVLDSLNGLPAKTPCPTPLKAVKTSAPAVAAKPRPAMEAFKPAKPAITNVFEFTAPKKIDLSLTTPAFTAPAETTKVVVDTVKSTPKVKADTLAPKSSWALLADTAVAPAVDTVMTPALSDTLAKPAVDSLPKAAQIADTAKAVIDSLPAKLIDTVQTIVDSAKTAVKDSVTNPKSTVKAVSDSVLTEWVPGAFKALK